MESFDFNKYLKEYREIGVVLPERYILGRFHAPKEMFKPLPAIECTDGFIFSVQASEYAYCHPRDNDGPYTHVEVGFPSEKIKELMEYADDSERPTDTVYGYVPVELVERIINYHNRVKKLIWTVTIFGKTLNIWWKKR